MWLKAIQEEMTTCGILIWSSAEKFGLRLWTDSKKWMSLSKNSTIWREGCEETITIWELNTKIQQKNGERDAWEKEGEPSENVWDGSLTELSRNIWYMKVTKGKQWFKATSSWNVAMKGRQEIRVGGRGTSSMKIIFFKDVRQLNVYFAKEKLYTFFRRGMIRFWDDCHKIKW